MIRKFLFSSSVPGLIGATLAVATMSCGDDNAAVEMKTGELVSFALAVTPFGSPNSSETAIAITPYNGTYNKVVAFNYDDPAHTSYTTTTWSTTSGASNIGWNYSIGADTNAAFQASPRRLVPPPGWPILWGDPGLGDNGAGAVFMTTIAIPQRKMPASGTISGSSTPYLGGACIARSVDGGQNFSVNAADCVHDANYSFYDGSDITGTTSNGPVLAAFENTVSKAIDVFVAPTPSNSFSQVANPFPGKTIVDHARVRRFGNAIYVAAADNANNIWVQVYFNGAWGTAAQGYPLLAGSGYSTADMTIGGQLIRRGASYDLDFAPSTNGPGALYVVYTKWNGHSYLSGTACSSSCTQNYFTVDPGVHAFHPSLGFQQQGNPGGASTFGVLTWVQATGGTSVRILSNTAFQGGGALSGRVETGPTTVCPDTRGYWGDYDAHLAVWPRSYPSKPLFWRAFTDSTNGQGTDSCTRQWKYTSLDVNVSATWIPL
jgi:hypothetical protein